MISLCIGCIGCIGNFHVVQENTIAKLWGGVGNRLCEPMHPMRPSLIGETNMKSVGEIYDAIRERADTDGQFAIAWALCQLTIEAKELKRGLVGDYSVPGILGDTRQFEPVALALESVAASISDVANSISAD